MFHRLHIQMTFFSALIIGIVIFIMTTACNFIAEKLRRRMQVSVTESCVLQNPGNTG